MESITRTPQRTHLERQESRCSSQATCIKSALLIIGALGVFLLAASLMDYIQIDWALLGWGLIVGSALGLFIRCVWGVLKGRAYQRKKAAQWKHKTSE